MPFHRIIANPVSGRGNGERSLPRIKKQLEDAGLDFDIIRTERPGHATVLARQAAQEGCQVVVASGGDGTCNEVLNGLMQAKMEDGRQSAMGVLTVGRGNDFAYSMGIPVDVDQGCAALAAGKRKMVDIGRVTGGLYPEGRFFGNGVGIGFDAVTGFEAVKLKYLTGFPSYMVAAIKTIFLYFTPPELKIAYDDQVLTQESLMVSIMNGRRMGGGFIMAPDSVSDDGLFDLCIVEKVSKLRIFTILPLFFSGTQGKNPAVKFRRARKVTITACKGSIPAHADGETICYEAPELTVELFPAQLELVI